jgi:hypothetical protein
MCTLRGRITKNNDAYQWFQNHHRYVLFWKISKVILKALIDNASDPEEGEDLIETAGKDYQRIESLDAYRRDGVASTVVFHQC